MELSLKNLVKSGNKACLIDVVVSRGLNGSIDSLDSVLRYETTEGFRFEVPLRDITGGPFPAEGKAIEFMKWIKKSLAEAVSAKIEQEAQTIQAEAMLAVVPEDDGLPF